MYILDILVFQTKENPTFKDNDFTKDNAKLRIGDEVKKDLLQRVKDDVEVRLLVYPFCMVWDFSLPPLTAHI